MADGMSVTEATSLMSRITGPASEVAARFGQLRKEITSGNVMVKTLAIIAALGMVLDGVFAFFSLLSLSPLRSLIEVYTFLAGVVALVIEGALSMRGFRSMEKTIREKASFLYVLTGRGAFYIFFGTLMVAQWPSLYDFILGIFVIFVGISMILAGREAASKLEGLRERVIDSTALRAKFDTCDVNKDGKLQPPELAALCVGFGSVMSPKQLEAAMFMLDKDHDGGVDYEEFSAWWRREGEVAMLAKYFRVSEDPEEAV